VVAESQRHGPSQDPRFLRRAWEPGESLSKPARAPPDGRLWFANQSAVQVVDPEHPPSQYTSSARAD